LNLKDRASGVRRLQDDEVFNFILDEIRGEQVRVFMDTGSSQDDREAAHDLIRALQKIEDQFQTILLDEAIFDKQQEKRTAPWKRLKLA
jgi:dihydroxyacetone kinase DhaKLM complex PTS-EIIA-like component DhaM